MLRYIMIVLLVGISSINATNIQDLDKLKVEKEILLLQLETYALKKKIIEMENFIENDKLKKEKRLAREKALIQLKNDLKVDKNTLKNG